MDDKTNVGDEKEGVNHGEWINEIEVDQLLTKHGFIKESDSIGLNSGVCCYQKSNKHFTFYFNLFADGHASLLRSNFPTPDNHVWSLYPKSINDLDVLLSVSPI